MPRGGNGKPDGYSPYKTADGRELQLLKSSKSRTGYHRIVEKHRGKFYPKLKLDAVASSKLQRCFGEGKPTAREAAIRLAEYLDEPHELPTAAPRAAPGSRLTEQQKKWKRLAELHAEACSLLGISEEGSDAEKARDLAQAEEFAAWRACKAGAPVVFDGPVLVVADEPVPVPEPQPARQWDADVLAKVARIQAAAPRRA